MANVRKFANTALNVTKIFAIGNGMNCPKTIARMIAMTTLSNNEILIFFIVFDVWS